MIGTKNKVNYRMANSDITERYSDFLGIIRAYQKCILDLVVLAEPLNILTIISRLGFNKYIESTKT
jgi:hypothetical protein